MSQGHADRIVDRQLIPALLFGAVLGGLVVALIREPHFPVPGLITAAATFIVGWLITGEVRRRAELERIPIEHVAQVGVRIDELVRSCFVAVQTEASKGGRREDELVSFVELSNDVYWVRELLEAFAPELAPLGRRAADDFFEMKRYLTNGDRNNSALAAEAGRNLRMTILEIQWKFCDEVVRGRVRRELPFPRRGGS